MSLIYDTPSHLKVGKNCEIAVFARGFVCGFMPHSYGDVPLSVKFFKYQGMLVKNGH